MPVVKDDDDDDEEEDSVPTERGGTSTRIGYDSLQRKEVIFSDDIFGFLSLLILLIIRKCFFFSMIIIC